MEDKKVIRIVEAHIAIMEARSKATQEMIRGMEQLNRLVAAILVECQNRQK